MRINNQSAIIKDSHAHPHSQNQQKENNQMNKQEIREITMLLQSRPTNIYSRKMKYAHDYSNYVERIND